MSKSPANGKEARYTMKSLRKALDLLELFTLHQELGTRELARMTSFDRSTVHRILVTFRDYGYLVQDSTNGKFRLGVRFLKLGTIAVHRFNLRDQARGIMRALSRDLNESVYLNIQEDAASVICIEEVLANRTLGLATGLGFSTPVHAAAAGKLFLAFGLPEMLQRFETEQRLLPVTQRTITDLPTFLEQVAEARAKGYALNDEESEIGVRYLAVPIFNHEQAIIGTLNLGAPIARLTDAKIQPYVVRMQQSAAEIAQQL